MSDRRVLTHAAALGVLVTAAALALFASAASAGRAQSYDTMLYARSLWGLAHGDPFNPVYGMHALGIHAQWVLYLLAPFARLFGAAQVLAFAQALAWGATASVATSALLRGDLHEDRAPWAALAAGGALAIAPLVANPFLFDLRPDIIAVPLLTAGLLRARSLGRVDLRAAGLCALAVLVREEFAVVAAASVLFAPLGPLWTSSAATAERRRDALQRLAYCAALAGYLALYWFVLRDVFAGEYAASRADEAAGDLFSAPGAWGYRGMLLLAAAGTLGGAALTGWRWLGAALPGMGLVVLLAKMPEHALNFHYAMFAAPALIVAAVDGWSRAASRTRAAHVALAVAASVAFGAMPGGARFQADAYGFDSEATAWHAEVRETLEALPDDAGIALPGAVGAQLADRPVIYSMETLRRSLREGQVPDLLVYTLLPAHEWQSLGYWLVHNAQWRRVRYLAGRFVLLERARADAVSPYVRSGETRCDADLGLWPQVGARLCAASAEGVVLERTSQGPDAPFAAQIFAVCREGATPLVIEGGLVELTQVPPGVSVHARFGGPCTAPRAVALRDDRGAPVRARAPGRGALDAELMWPPAPDAQ